MLMFRTLVLAVVGLVLLVGCKQDAPDGSATDPPKGARSPAASEAPCDLNWTKCRRKGSFCACRRTLLELTETWDWDNDGKPNRRRVQVFDPKKQMVREERDLEADGKLDEITERDYDAKGRYTVERYDREGDGVFDRATRYTYDAEGRWVREEHDEGPLDGKTDRTCTYDPPCKLPWNIRRCKARCKSP